MHSGIEQAKSQKTRFFAIADFYFTFTCFTCTCTKQQLVFLADLLPALPPLLPSSIRGLMMTDGGHNYHFSSDVHTAPSHVTNILWRKKLSRSEPTFFSSFGLSSIQKVNIATNKQTNKKLFLAKSGIGLVRLKM